MDEASERSLSLLRTLSQEHIERVKSCQSQEEDSNLPRNSSTARIKSNFNYNRIRKINQSIASGFTFFPDKDHHHHLTSSSASDDRHSHVQNDIVNHSVFANMENKQSSYNNQDDQIDIESRLAYDDYFEGNPKAQHDSRSSKFIRKHKSNNMSHSSIDDLIYDDKAQQYYSLDELVDQNIYIVKQKAGYFSIGFSLVQTLILVVMMIECSVAPLNINPMIGPYPDALDYWGAKNTSKILDDSEWWRLITPLFLHGGIIHLLCNISVQLDVGAFFEREWGSALWLVIYFASGLGSSIFSCIFSPDNLSVGSSGAVMGLFGGKLGEIFCRACESRKTKAARVGHEVRMEQLQQSLCSVLIVLAFSFVPFVDWAAHMGGTISGFTAGMLCFAPWIKTKHCAVFWFAIGIAMNLAFYILTLTYMYTSVQPRNDLRDVCEYYKQYFEDYECNCQIN